MSRLLTVLLVSLLVVSAARADDAEEVLASLKVLNQAFEKANPEALKTLMAEDHVAVTNYYGGPVNRETQLKTLNDFNLTKYETGKMKVRMLGKEGALVTYVLEAEGTFKGKPVAKRSFAAAVWVKQDGKWKEVSYQETALDEK